MSHPSGGRGKTATSGDARKRTLDFKPNRRCTELTAGFARRRMESRSSGKMDFPVTGEGD